MARPNTPCCHRKASCGTPSAASSATADAACARAKRPAAPLEAALCSSACEGGATQKRCRLQMAPRSAAGAVAVWAASTRCSSACALVPWKAKELTPATPALPPVMAAQLWRGRCQPGAADLAADMSRMVATWGLTAARCRMPAGQEEPGKARAVLCIQSPRAGREGCVPPQLTASPTSLPTKAHRV